MNAHVERFNRTKEEWIDDNEELLFSNDDLPQGIGKKPSCHLVSP